MRENRLSGSMRGGEFPEALTTTVGLILFGELPAYSTFTCIFGVHSTSSLFSP